MFTAGCFSCKDGPLAGCSPMIASYFAICPEYPVTRNQIGDRIMPDGGSHGPVGSWMPYGIGQTVETHMGYFEWLLLLSQKRSRQDGYSVGIFVLGD